MAGQSDIFVTYLNFCRWRTSMLKTKYPAVCLFLRASKTLLALDIDRWNTSISDEMTFL